MALPLKLKENMKANYTKNWLLNLAPCKDGLRFAAKHNYNFKAVWQQCPRGDWLLWLLERSTPLTKEQALQLAVSFAEHVLPIFEARYPKDKRPRAALAAAKACDVDAAFAAYAADAAARAACAAAYAADAADRAACAAAYADAAAAAAAYDADAAAAAAAYAVADAYATEQLWQANTIRALVSCPF